MDFSSARGPMKGYPVKPLFTGRGHRIVRKRVVMRAIGFVGRFAAHKGRAHIIIIALNVFTLVRAKVRQRYRKETRRFWRGLGW